MDFTYDAYRSLIKLLKEKGYTFADYHNYAEHPRCVIMRHDVDNSLEQSVRLAEVEAQEGITSTYFVLLRTSFYNPASAQGLAAIRKIHELGHEIGLHFDEVAYSEEETRSVPELIRQEATILSSICGFPITTVSMHRPSQKTLESNLEIPGMINSYGQVFFHDFKYLSDSRRNWREPVMEIVAEGTQDRLHILTHAFWYHEKSYTIGETVSNFVKRGNMDRYIAMSENIRDIESIMQVEGL